VKLSDFLADNDAVTFKESYGTHPRVFYVTGHGHGHGHGHGQDADADAGGT